MNIYRKPQEVVEYLMTQAVRGEPLEVIKTSGEWARVVAAHYPDKPGWALLDQVGEGEKTLKQWLEEQTEFVGRPPYQIARQYLNTPYLQGGLTNKGIDSPGLVHVAYRKLCKLIPRDADGIENYARKVDPEKIRPGDLITYTPGKISKLLENPGIHIAFWLGDGKILHSFGWGDYKCVLIHLEPRYLREQRRRVLRIA